MEAAKDPLISVITIVRNDAVGLARTLPSLHCQSWKDREHVIVDGASTDRTVDVIREHNEWIDRWISEPDAGIANAFNKGIRLSRGKWLAFLNAGDSYIDEDSLEILARAAIEHGDSCAIVSGYCRSPEGNYRFPAEPPREQQSLFQRARQAHQACLLKRELFDRYGMYDEGLRICMDTEFLLRVLQEERFFFIERDLCHFDVSGISSNYLRFLGEILRVELGCVRDPRTATQFVCFELGDFAKRVARRVKRWVPGSS